MPGRVDMNPFCGSYSPLLFLLLSLTHVPVSLSLSLSTDDEHHHYTKLLPVTSPFSPSTTSSVSLLPTGVLPSISTTPFLAGKKKARLNARFLENPPQRKKEGYWTQNRDTDTMRDLNASKISFLPWRASLRPVLLGYHHRPRGRTILL